MLTAGARTVVLIGKESAGKSALAAVLTGVHAYSANFRGSTLACERYSWGPYTVIDTPGIDSAADSEAAADALKGLEEADLVLLVVPAMHAGEDLRDLLPLAGGKRGIVAVTFRDKDSEADPAALPKGLRAVRLDARQVSARERQAVIEALDAAGVLPETHDPAPRPKARRPPWRWPAPAAASGLLLLPAVGAVMATNRLAASMEPGVQAALASSVEWAGTLPAPLAAALAGPYGLLTMGPLLFVWAAPVVIFYAVLLALFKASGLIDWIGFALDRFVRPFGLTGRDLPRVLMGFGCNVPAVASTRSCAAGGRNTCISVISFGSACSYQLGATLSVFGAAGKAWLAAPYLVFLGAATLLYARWISGGARAQGFRILSLDRAFFIERPRLAAVWREIRAAISQFFVTALPVFFAISLAASALGYAGAPQRLTAALGPVAALFRLPGEAVLAVVMGSIRKDGILLLAERGAANGMTAVQLLTAVFLAGVLLPCLVTWLTIARERGAAFAARMASRQAAAACFFAFLLAWGGFLFE
jgi:Fe2+ transport system protein B